jgi:Flp pilus assembly protein TadG
MSARRPTGGSGRRDRGAVIVEFAILLAPLFLIIFGIIEFGNAYSQNLDVRHGAREGARLVAVNYKPTAATGDAQSTIIRTEICTRMGASSTTQVRLQRTGPAAGTDTATVTVQRPLTQLTNFLNFALSGKTLTSTVQTRLEQTATWNATAMVSCP